MNIHCCFFGGDIKELKNIIRNQIETEVEGTLEEERDESFVQASLNLDEKIQYFGAKQKETLRVDTLRQLEDQRMHIYALWELFIARTVRFQCGFDILFFSAMIVAIIAFFTGFFGTALFAMIVVVLCILVSSMENIYSNLSYIFTGSGFIFNDLLKAYNRYGELEAKLRFSDFRGFSHVEDRDKKHWVYTSTHIIKASP